MGCSPVVELGAVFLAQGAAVGEEVLVGRGRDELLGRGDPLLLELVGGSTIGLLVEVVARDDGDGDSADVVLPALGVVVPHQAVPVAAGIVVETAAPGGDETACVHLVVILELGGVAQVAGLLQPVGQCGVGVMTVEAVQVGKELEQRVAVSIEGFFVFFLIGLVKGLLFGEKEVAQQLAPHPDEVDGHGVGGDTFLLEQGVPHGEHVAWVVLDLAAFLAHGRIGAGQGGSEVARGDVEHFVIEQSPSLARMSVFAPRMSVGEFVDDLFVGLGEVPCLLEDVLIGELLHVEALEGRADAHKVVATLGKGFFDAFARLLDAALYVGVAAEVAQVAPDEGLVVEAVVLAPHLLVLAVVVEHRHLALRHAGEHGAGALAGVVLALVIEEPGHLQPLGLRVDGREAFIDVLGDRVEVVGLKTGGIHLVERVDAVDVVGAE